MKKSICYSEDKALGLMFGMVFGNVLGAALQTSDSTQIFPIDEEYIRNHVMRYYTADIQTAVSVLEEMGENAQIDQVSLQKRFIRRYSPWRGYAGGLLDVINRWKDGEAISSAASSVYNGTGNFGVGAAVRSGPLSLFFRENECAELFEQVRRNALITHTHPYGIAGAQLFAFIVLLALNEVPSEKWLDPVFKLPIESAFKIKIGQVAYCIENHSTVSEAIERIGSGAEAIEAVPAALYAAMRYPDSLIDAVGYAIALGGDVDTVSAMAGSIIGARLGHRHIPMHLIADVEKDGEGVEYIKQLVRRYCEE